MFLLTNTFIERLDKHRHRFFWQGGSGKKRYHLVKWSRVCISKCKGGLVVKELRQQNISLLVKWSWKLDTQDGLWQDIIRAKYLKRDTVATVKGKFSDSPIWKAIMKVKEHYIAGREVTLNSGDVARFCLDPLRGNQPLYSKFSELFGICNMQDIIVDKWKSININTFFRRRLGPSLSSQWEELCSLVVGLNLSNEPDKIVWALEPKKRFTTKSIYEHLEIRILRDVTLSGLGRPKSPLKFKFSCGNFFFLLDVATFSRCRFERGCHE